MADKISNGKKPNFLSAAEINYSENYNMIGDGNINNITKPSMLERLQELEQRKRERHKEGIVDDRRERHKADFQENRDNR